jgi:hypothetical protein
MRLSPSPPACPYHAVVTLVVSMATPIVLALVIGWALDVLARRLFGEALGKFLFVSFVAGHHLHTHWTFSPPYSSPGPSRQGERRPRRDCSPNPFSACRDASRMDTGDVKRRNACSAFLVLTPRECFATVHPRP